MTIISDTILRAWTTGRKTHRRAKGWITGNCPCCMHNGESADKRGRGGLIISDGDNSISYSCFNCQYKASYTAGYPLHYKFRKLLKWLNVDESEIQRLNIEAKREQQRQELLGLVKAEPAKKEELKVDFKKIPLPDESVSFYGLVEFYELKAVNGVGHGYPTGFVEAVTYVSERKINMNKYDFYWSSDTKFKMNKRVIIPFTWKDEIIGYSARAFNNDISPKYIQQVDAGYVFNIDKQGKNWQFVIVCEGVFDAISIDGVAVLKADITRQQIDIIESLDREIIVVPDWNKTGANLIDVALKNSWSVSFPVWAETCEDINQAVQKYGKLFTLKAILDGVENNALKIKLLRKKYGKE